MTKPVWGMTALTSARLACGEELDEEPDPLLPGSEQLMLQQSRAMETSAPRFAECAFLQQSGILDVGHEPSCS